MSRYLLPVALILGGLLVWAFREAQRTKNRPPTDGPSTAERGQELPPQEPPSKAPPTALEAPFGQYTGER